MMDYRDDMQKRHEYVKGLEEERRKIEMLQRDLPLCLHLVTQAIETNKQQLVGATTDCNLDGESDCSEETTSGDEGVVFEEFIPIKISCSSPQQVQEEDGELESRINDKLKKSDWLRSVQLWSQSSDPPTIANEGNQSDQPRKVLAVGVRRKGGAFHPYKKESSHAKCDGVFGNTSAAPAASLCSTGKRTATRKDEGRKPRRCWSPELHRKFINALQHLGGPHVATPKQIKDLMNVDGLTNNEVKSHLQKYRLHRRGQTPSLYSNANTQSPQFVVLRGLWMPPPEYAVTTTNVAPPSGVYAPLAAPLPPHHQATAILPQQCSATSQPGTRGKGAGGSSGARCNSPTASSSTCTTTTT